MRQVKRWRYYCEFCKKAGGSKGHIVAHEKSCTNNPDRVCRMCGYIGDPQPDLSEMIAIIKNNIVFCGTDDFESYVLQYGVNEMEILALLREKTDCPTCLLAALRQSKASYLFPSFKFKEERDEFWKEHNETEGHYW